MDYMVGEHGKYSDRWAYLQKPYEKDKAMCLTANIHRGIPYNILAEPVFTEEAEPAAMRQVGRRINEQGHRDDYNEAIPHFQYFEVNDNPQKTNCPSTVEKDNMIAVPVRVGDMPNVEGIIRGGQAHRIYDSDGKAVTLTAHPNGGVDGPLYATPVMAEHMVDAEKNQTVSRSIDEIVEKKGYLPEMFNPYNRAEIREKSPTLSTGSMVTSSCATLVVEELEQPDAPVRIGTIENAAKNPDHDSQQYRVYSPDGKAVTLCGAGGYWSQDRIVRCPCQLRPCECRRRPNWDMQKSSPENVWTCPCRTARQGGDER